MNEIALCRLVGHITICQAGPTGGIYESCAADYNVQTAGQLLVTAGGPGAATDGLVAGPDRRRKLGTLGPDRSGRGIRHSVSVSVLRHSSDATFISTKSLLRLKRETREINVTERTFIPVCGCISCRSMTNGCTGTARLPAAGRGSPQQSRQRWGGNSVYPPATPLAPRSPEQATASTGILCYCILFAGGWGLAEVVEEQVDDRAASPPARPATRPAAKLSLQEVKQVLVAAGVIGAAG